jgi:hypothetical protein
MECTIPRHVLELHQLCLMHAMPNRIVLSNSRPVGLSQRSYGNPRAGCRYASNALPSTSYLGVCSVWQCPTDTLVASMSLKVRPNLCHARPVHTRHTPAAPVALLVLLEPGVAVDSPLVLRVHTVSSLAPRAIAYVVAETDEQPTPR